MGLSTTHAYTAHQEMCENKQNDQGSNMNINVQKGSVLSLEDVVIYMCVFVCVFD